MSEQPPPGGHDGGEPEERVEQPTEELFALEARLLSGDEDVPDLDPQFRAALLEEAAEPSEPAEAEPPTDGGESQPTDGGDSIAGRDPDPDEDGDGPPEEAGEEPVQVTDEQLRLETGEHADEALVEQTDEREAVGAYDPITERTAVLGAEARREVHQAMAEAKDSGVPWDPSRPPTGGDGEPPPKRKRYWWRFALATVIIVLSFASATSASILLVFDKIAGDLGHGKSIKLDHGVVVPPAKGGPQTILILGSDKRKDEGDAGRSDTTILLRLDPDKKLVSMLSIPRDLKVDIPGYGVGKFNAAYTAGGTNLTVKTIKQLTGLQINHVINVDFLGFARAVDAIHCVFVDVDRKYYHSNVGVPPSEQYSEIDIDAGYQKLCGADALAYVRYRHTDTDLVRSARQQEFLRDARGMVPPTELWKDRDELIKILTDYTHVDPDLKDVGTLLDMSKLLFALRGADVNKVEFPVTLGPSYVYSTEAKIHHAVRKFLDGDVKPGGASGPESGPGGQQETRVGAQSGSKSKSGKKPESKAPPKDDGLVDASDSGREQAEKLAAQTGPTFPIFYPTRVPASAIYSEYSRMYHLRDLDKNSHAAYRIVLYFEENRIDYYFGLQGIRDWEDPPILSAPHTDLTMGGRDYQVYTEGGRVRMVSWTAGGNAYWISNTLTQELDNDQMLGMARSVSKVTPAPIRVKIGDQGAGGP